MIEVKCAVVGVLDTNCYILKNAESGEMALIDPGYYKELVYTTIMQMGGNLRYILLTHGHYDHIGGVYEFQKLFPNAVTYIGKKDAVCLTDDHYNLSDRLSIRKFTHFSADLLNDGDEIKFGNSVIKFIETPGHTAGSGCYLVEDKLFSGDTLFKASCGRTDFPGSSTTDMIKSLKKLAQLEGNYRVFPGHNEFSSLDFERVNNPYIVDSYEDIY